MEDDPTSPGYFISEAWPSREVRSAAAAGTSVNNNNSKAGHCIQSYCRLHGAANTIYLAKIAKLGPLYIGLRNILIWNNGLFCWRVVKFIVWERERVWLFCCGRHSSPLKKRSDWSWRQPSHAPQLGYKDSSRLGILSSKVPKTQPTCSHS